MADEKSLFPLKMLAVSLGVLLLGGVILLGTVALSRANRCAKAEVDFSRRGEISGLRTEEGNVIVMLKHQSDKKVEVVTLDACSGREKGALTILGQ